MPPKTRTNKKHNNKERLSTSSDTSDNESSSVNLTGIIDNLNKEFKVQERAMKKIRESQEHISDSFDALKKEIDRLTEENKQIKKELKELKTNGEGVKIKMKTLERNSVVMEIAAQVNANINIDSIEDVYQNENKKFKTHPLIVKMSSNELKAKCFEFRKKGSHIDLKKILPNVDMKGKNINFHQLMEKELSDLMKKAKNAAYKKSYKYVWVKDAKILVRKDDDTPVIQIMELEDLKKLD
ncbi:PREDICTED: intracellular protein transport protein USO1-like [Rhagoletis zephyria]|uniref:intracellular protein transport protein USO1-like n=1 Tax=Rhagoletis zephyria TaxID=28612 RepID=UPI0008116FC8|nr:PREDICTED: intracellular protein transport protein USO1-like [Rhagoletis zephyria]